MVTCFIHELPIKLGLNQHKFSVPFRNRIQAHFAAVEQEEPHSRFLEIELTHRCDQACDFCGVNAPNNVDLDTKALYHYLEQWLQETRRQQRFPILSLTGGDPVLYSGFPELIQYLHSHQIPFFIKGNPQTWRSHPVPLAHLEYCGGIKFTVPLAGAVSSNRPDLFSDLLTASAALREAGIDVVWQLSLYQDNLASSFRFLSRIGHYLPVDLTFTRIQALGSAKRNGISILSLPEYVEVLNTALLAYSEYCDAGMVLLFKDPIWVPILKHHDLLDPTATYHTGCHCSDHQACLTPTGQLLQCGLSREKIMGTI